MIYRFGDCSLDVARQELRRGADLASVEPKVLDLLLFLIRNRERVVSKDDLIAHVWQGRIVSESTLTSRITAARQAIGDSGEHQRLIRTVARKGLRFVGDVREDRGGMEERPPSLAHIQVEEPKPAPRNAERRPIAILHCRVVGLTPLAAQLEPEDLGEAIAVIHGCIRAIVGRHKGHVAKCDGDEAQAYFGYLQAAEDDAERAVQAGLAIVAAVGGLAVKAAQLKASVGIATGLVVVGEAQGDIAATTIGETPFLASSLLAAAAPGKVVISAGTRRLIGKLFECRRMIAGPIEAFEVVRHAAVESRFEALERWGSASLVGRDEELELLTRRWEQVQDGSGRVVLVVGEPGIGKSRLVQGLRDRIRSASTQIVFHCSPHHQDSALHPVIGRLTRACAIERDDGADEKLGKLESLLEQSGARDPDEIALLASLLSIPAGDRYPLSAPSPRLLRERTFVALLAYLKRMAARAPLLVVFEDVHWIDPTSLELLSLMVDQAPTMRLLIVATFRPEFKPPWASSRHVSTILLGRLGRDEGHALVAGILRGKTLPADVLDQILDRTDGIPLYIEELSKSVVESGLLRVSTDRFELAGLLTARAIPSTLHASLAARLDRLGPVKEVAQIGAAIGRRFSFGQIAAVAGLPDPELQARLTQLVAAELLFERGLPPDATYQFKHALVQEAAYASLVRGRRQHLHGEIARALEQQFPDVALAEPETLAYHLSEAGLADRSVVFWLRAGQRAAERSADREAVRHLERGIALLHSLPESAARDRTELEFQITLGTPLAAVHGYASSKVGAAAERATLLAERLNDAASLFAPLYAHYTFLYITGETRNALRLAKRLHALAGRQGERVLRMMANRAMGVVTSQVGEFATGRDHYEQALSLYDHEQDGVLAARFLTDPFASTSALLSISLWISGYPERAARMNDRALDFAARLNHVHTGGLVHHFAAHLAALSGDATAVLAHTQAMSDLAVQHNVQAWRSHWIIWEGWARGWLGEHETGIALMREGIAIQDARSQTYHVAYYTSLLARIHARAGDLQQALSLSAEAQERARRTEEQYWRAELDRIEGELRRTAGHADEAVEGCFTSALEVSRRQGAKMFELRAATSLARLWCDRHRRADAHEVLAPVYRWFTEGTETPDLKSAKALLDRTPG